MQGRCHHRRSRPPRKWDATRPPEAVRSRAPVHPRGVAKPFRHVVLVVVVVVKPTSAHTSSSLSPRSRLRPPPTRPPHDPENKHPNCSVSPNGALGLREKYPAVRPLPSSLTRAEPSPLVLFFLVSSFSGHAPRRRLLRAWSRVSAALAPPGLRPLCSPTAVSSPPLRLRLRTSDSLTLLA
mmetsp:Transcript_25990/g.103990  ORF Transcript_25990/g.103990 Transcript_25990/m.103990 type:complete len:181 (+) Transcript_25990:2318-2860(+)